MDIDKEIENTIKLINQAIDNSKTADMDLLDKYLTEQYSRLQELQKCTVESIIKGGKGL